MDINVNNNEENEVVVIGGGNAESIDNTTTDAPKPKEEEKPKADDLPDPKKETTTDDDKPKTEDAPKPKKEEEQIRDNKENPLKISFGKEKETPTPDADKKEEALSVTESMVVDFMKSKGVDVENISQLSRKVELPDEVAKFMKFHQETGGRGHSDFFNSQKDWANESKDDTIKAFLKMKNDLTDEDVEKHFGLLEVTDEERDALSEREITRRELEYDDKYREALGYMTSKSKEYQTYLGNREVQKPLTEEQIMEAHKPYWARRDKSLEALNEINISLGEIGDVSVNLTQDQKDLVSEYTETQDAFFARFRNDKGEIDTDKSNESVLWGIKEVRESMLSDIFEQTYALVIDSISKKNRNVDLDDIKKQVHQELKQGGVEELGGNSDNSMGQSILS